MEALQNRVGRDKLRIVLLSQPKYWEADKKLAKALDLRFEMIVPKQPPPSTLAAINLSNKPNGFMFPETSFLRSNGTAIEAFQSIKDWDTVVWVTIVIHWYNAGLYSGQDVNNSNDSRG